MTSHPLLRRGACAIAWAALAVPLGSVLGAQGAPPPAPARGDAAPALRAPVRPGPGPETHAPRPATVRAATTRASTVRAPADSTIAPRSPSVSVDSVRPAQTRAAAVDPQRAPLVPPPPPAPGSLRTTNVQSASAVSDVVPVGATARCKDGSFVSGSVDQNTCSDRGGVVVIFAAPLPKPRPPQRP